MAKKRKQNPARKRAQQALRARMKLFITAGTGIKLSDNLGGDISEGKWNALDNKHGRWIFTPKYPQFPKPHASIFSQTQVAECNKALDNGSLSVKPRQKIGTKALALGGIRHDKLVDTIKELALKYIAHKTGTKVDIVTALGGASQFSAEWQWSFNGRLSHFPGPDPSRLEAWSDKELAEFYFDLQNGHIILGRRCMNRTEGAQTELDEAEA